MQGTESYDSLILGSGEAGKYIAWTLAKSGRRTAVVERKLIGGSCPNIACLPSKNVINSARVSWLVHGAAEYGISTGPVSVDMTGVRAHKRKMVDGLIAIHRRRFEASGAELIMGEGRFVAPRTMEVRLAEGGGSRLLTADQIFLDVGTRAAIPDIPGLAQASPLTHIEALELGYLPQHVLVIGGGYVGLEFAQALRRFGSRVTVVEQSSQLAPLEDSDVGNELLQLFRDEGIDVVLNARSLKVEGRTGVGVRVQLDAAGSSRTLEGSDLLAATGRIPNTQGIGLDIAGIEVDARGYIRVNERLETTASKIWAMGDCAGSPLFTHVAFDDFRIVRDNLKGGKRSTRDRLVPYCVFTDPELARVGLNETQAQRSSTAYRVFKTPMTAVLRARALTETRGFMKALVDPGTDRILGFTAFGPHVGELVSVVQTAMLCGAPYTTLRDAILTHPTIAEGLNVLFTSD